MMLGSNINIALRKMHMMLKGNIAHDIAQCSLSGIPTFLPTEEGGVIEFDGHRQKGPPVVFCGAPR